MKPHFGLIMLALGVFVVFTEAREFTSTDGRKLNGEVIGVKGDNVVIKVGTRSYTVPKNRFIKADQDYFKQWAEEFAKNLVPKLEVMVASGKKNRSDRSDSGLGDDRTGAFELKVEITNNEQNFDLEKAKARIVAIGEDVEDSKNYLIMQNQKFDVNVEYGKTFSWTGPSVSYRFDDNYPSKWGHKYVGYALEIQNSAGKVIYSKAIPSKFNDKVADLVSFGFSTGFDRNVSRKSSSSNYIN